jgi:hypothetical protein
VAQRTPAAFFSYSRDDFGFALRLAEDLKAARANVWMDQLDIKPGMPWDPAVESAVTDCPQMLVILSPKPSTLRTFETKFHCVEQAQESLPGSLP